MVQTLKSNRDFRRVYARGKSYHDPALVTIVLKNRAGICRIGITTGKKIGSAVQRNRARRVIRAAFREVYPFLRPGYDIVFVARSQIHSQKSTDLSRVIWRHLRKAKLLNTAEEAVNVG